MSTVSMTSLTPTGTPASRPRPSGPVDRTRLGQCLFRVEPGPGLDLGAGCCACSRQSRVRASEVNVPSERRAAASLAVRRSAPLMAGLPARVGVRPRDQPRAAAHRRGGIRPADPDRQPVWAMPGGQGQARHPELRPQCVEDRRTGGCEPSRSLARSRQGQDRVEAAGPLSRRRARPFGAAAGVAEGLQRQLAAPRNLPVAQALYSAKPRGDRAPACDCADPRRTRSWSGARRLRRIRAAIRCRGSRHRRRRGGRRAASSTARPSGCASSQCGPRHSPSRGAVSGIAGGA